MIPNRKLNKVKYSQKTEIHKVKTVDNFSFITDLVINIYTNPERAIMRELVSNAVDEHVKYNIERPIDLHIPTRSEQYFSVRDYGKGLSHEDMIDLFPTIGMSTKTDTNDLVGGFGIGRLSVFACSDSAIITSIHDNVKRVYLWNRAEDSGIDLSLQHEISTDEPSGLEIKCEVSGLAFSDELDVLSFFETPINSNVAIPENIDPLLSGKKWKAYRSYILDDDKVIMGGVPYPLNRDEFIDFYNLAFVIEMPIGSLDLTNNRDNIRYSSRSRKALKEFFEVVKSELNEVIQKTLDEEKSVIDAVRKYKDDFFFLRRLSVTYKGQDYTLNKDVSDIAVNRRNASRRSQGNTLSKTSKLFEYNRMSEINSIIVVDDLGKLSEKCIRHYINKTDIKYHKHVNIFESIDQAKSVTLRDPDDFLIVSEYLKTIPKSENNKKKKSKEELTLEKADVFLIPKGEIKLGNLRGSLIPVNKKCTDKFDYYPIYRYEISGAELFRRFFYEDLFLLRENKATLYPNATNKKPIFKEKSTKLLEFRRKHADKIYIANTNYYKFLKKMVDLGYKNDEAIKLIQKYKYLCGIKHYTNFLRCEDPILKFLKNAKGGILNCINYTDHKNIDFKSFVAYQNMIEEGKI